MYYGKFYGNFYKRHTARRHTVNGRTSSTHQSKIPNNPTINWIHPVPTKPDARYDILQGLVGKYWKASKYNFKHKKKAWYMRPLDLLGHYYTRKARHMLKLYGTIKHRTTKYLNA